MYHCRGLGWLVRHPRDGRLRHELLPAARPHRHSVLDRADCALYLASVIDSTTYIGIIRFGKDMSRNAANVGFRFSGQHFDVGFINQAGASNPFYNLLIKWERDLVSTQLIRLRHASGLKYLHWSVALDPSRSSVRRSPWTLLAARNRYVPPTPLSTCFACLLSAACLLPRAG